MIFTKKKKFYGTSLPKLLEQKKYPGWTLKEGATQSMLSEFLACRERARLSYKEGWTSVITSNAITFGSLFHNCVENVYRCFQLKIKPEGINVSSTIDNVLTKFKKDASIWTPDDENNHLLNTGYLKSVFTAYCDHYLKKDSKTTWFNVEEEFDVVLEDVRFRGKFDRLQVNKYGEIWVWDTKTKGRIDPTIQDKLSFDLQMMVYILAYEKQSGKLPTGFVYDIIQRPQLRKGASETLKHFMDRVKGDVDETYFHRIRMRLDPEEFKRWKEEFKQIVVEFKAWAEGKLPTYRNPASCETRYGACRFLKVCGMKDYIGLHKKEKVFSELENK